MTTTNVEGEVVNALVLNSMCIFPKNQKCPFIPRIEMFPELHFYIPKVPFFFPRSVFLFNVCVYFKRFFPKVFVLSTCPAQSCSKMIFALPLKTLRGV